MKKTTKKSENLSSEVTDEDLNNSVTDEFGVRYSKDGKRLLDASDLNCSSYSIKEGTLIVGNGAFSDCYFLEEVTIPDSVTTIGDSAFSDCWSLQNVIIPDSVTTIGDSAFSDCWSLQNVIIPDSVTTIGDRAFYDCDSLQNLTIPKSLVNMGINPFSGCNIKNFQWLSNHYEYDRYSLYNKHKEIIIALIKTDVSDFIIPDSVTSIWDDAFRGCSSLQSVTIPDSVTTIGNWAFSGCSSLQSVIIPDSVTTIGWDAFSGCSSLQSITIPDSVTSIESSAFSGCSSLQSVTIPDSVKTIGWSAFLDCYFLEEVTIPDSVTTIGSIAFRGCSSLQSVTIPDSVTAIESSAFENCSSLQSVTIPDSVVNIGSNPFSGCNIKNFLCLSNHYEYDGYSLYSKHKEIIIALIKTDVSGFTIPDSVTAIESSAFENCSSLQSVTIPVSVTAIKSDAFRGCSSLQSITIPESVISIENTAFEDCSSLQSVFIPESWISRCDSVFSSTGSEALQIFIYKRKELMLSQTTEKRLEGMKNDLLSLSQASKMYDVSKVTLKKWEEIGLIKPITLGSRNKYLSKEAMDKLLDSKITFDEQKLQDYKKEIHNEMKEYSDRLRDLKIQRNIIGEFEAKKYRDILLKIFTTLNPGVDCPPDRYDTMLQFLSGKSIVDLARESKVTSPAIVYKINSSLKMLDEFCKTVRKSEDTFKENEELLRQNDRLKKKIEMLEAGARIAGNRGVSRKNPIDVLNLNIRKENTKLNNILSTRCLNALSYLNIVTVGELSKMKKLTLQLTPGVGKGSLNQIEKFLSKYGLELE